MLFIFIYLATVCYYLMVIIIKGALTCIIIKQGEGLMCPIHIPRPTSDLRFDDRLELC